VDKKQAEQARDRRSRVKTKEGGKIVFGRITKVVGNSATIKPEGGGETIYKHYWEVELAE